MKVLICLAVFLVASLSSGEALQCRMCQSSNASDYCTDKPLLVGVHECGKHESDIKKTLLEIESTINKTIGEAELKQLDELMMTLEGQREMIEEHYVTLSTDTEPGIVKEKIEMLRNPYQSIKVFAAVIKDLTGEQPKKDELKTKLVEANDTIDLSKIDISKIQSEIEVLLPIQRAYSDTVQNESVYGTFGTEFKKIQTSLATPSMTELDKIYSQKAGLTASIGKLNVTVAKEVDNLKKALDAITGITESISTTKSKITGLTFTSTKPTSQKTDMDNANEAAKKFFDYVTKAATFCNTVIILKNRTMMAVEASQSCKLGKTLADTERSANIESLKEKTTAAIKAIPAIEKSSWMCFKEIKDKKTVIRRGCTEKTNATDVVDKLYRCDKDGCNSSTTISIGVMPIFIAIALALGFSR